MPMNWNRHRLIDQISFNRLSWKITVSSIDYLKIKTSSIYKSSFSTQNTANFVFKKDGAEHSCYFPNFLIGF